MLNRLFHLAALPNWFRSGKHATQDDIITAIDARIADDPAMPYLLLIAAIDDDAAFHRLAEDGREVILQALETRSRANLPERELLRRLETGHFAFLLRATDCQTTEAVVGRASEVQDLFAARIATGHARAQVSASVGCICTVAHPFRDGTALLEAAMLAQSYADQQGPGGLRLFEPAMAEAHNLHQSLKGEAQEALHSGAIQAHFQPQITLKTRELTGFEALARWQHPARGILCPADFLPVLEDEGLMPTLSTVILSQALTALRTWDAAGFYVPQVSINFSAQELRDPDLVTEIETQLQSFQIAPNRLVIEVLETAYATTANDASLRN